MTRTEFQHWYINLIQSIQEMFGNMDFFWPSMISKFIGECIIIKEIDPLEDEK